MRSKPNIVWLIVVAIVVVAIVVVAIDLWLNWFCENDGQFLCDLLQRVSSGG